MWAILSIFYFMRSFFFLSVFSRSEVLAKITSIRSKLPTAACWFREKREETVKPTCFIMSKATSVPQTPQTNHSQCSSPVEALNLIESKSQPVELDHSTIELHAPSKWKKSLQSCCSVDFDFLALCGLIWPSTDVTLRDDSSFGKLTNSCNSWVALSRNRKSNWKPFGGWSQEILIIRVIWNKLYNRGWCSYNS